MDDEGVLELAQRSRPQTIAELARLARLDDAHAATIVARLAARGALVVRGDELVHLHPTDRVAAEVAREVAALRADTDVALARVVALVGELPAHLRHWAAGEATIDTLPVEVRHGPRAAEDLWYTTTRTGGRAAAVFPDISRFLDTDATRSARFAQAFGTKESVRGILPAAPLADPAVAARAARYLPAGVEFRVMLSPPSWFWIDEDLLAVPFRWGEGWPSSVLGVRNPALADLARAYFDRLWHRAQPLVAVERPWTPLLRLMREGATLDAASRALGINPRTGRRRVAAAMEHYGVSTLFALGTAWSADGASHYGAPAPDPE